MALRLEDIVLSSILLLLSDSLIYQNVIVPVAESATSVSSFFESPHEDYGLLGHVIDVCTGDDLVCGLECLRKEKCRSYNCFAAENLNAEICYLNDETRFSRPEDFKESPGSTYFNLMQISNSKFVCDTDDGRSTSNQSYCKCKEIHCSSGQRLEKLGLFAFPGHSCKHIRDSGDSRGDGEYWIDPAKDGNPIKVYCDMTTDQGGWLLVANLLIKSSTPPAMGWDPETTYRGVSNYHNNRMAIPLSAMKELRTHLSFTQLRFHCSKQQGRTFHVTTVANSTGEAVVQYFSGQTDARPLACNSFKRLDGDNSQLAMQCDRWGSNSNGKWGNRNRRGEYMMYTQSAFILGENRWSVANGKWWCDDHGNNMISSGDFWKVYVR